MINERMMKSLLETPEPTVDEILDSQELTPRASTNTKRISLNDLPLFLNASDFQTSSPKSGTKKD